MLFRTITCAVLTCFAAFVPRSNAEHCEELLLYYSFDNIESNVVEDLSGNEHHGLAYFASPVAGVSGDALDFKNFGWVDAGDILDIGPEHPVLTVVAWVKSVRAPIGDFIVGKQQDFFPGRGWAIRMDPETRADLVAINNSEQAKAVDSEDIRNGEWHCVVGVFETSPMLLRSSVYVDGVLKASDERIGSHASTETIANLWIGKQYPGYSDGILGSVDEVRVFGRALSADEIEAIADDPAFDPCRKELKNWLSRIGFSNDPEGDQDVTEFYPEETLIVTIADVQISAPEMKKATLELKQSGHGKKGGNKKEKYFFELGHDGLWRAAAPLAEFEPSEIEVKIDFDAGGKRKLKRESSIRLHE